MRQKCLKKFQDLKFETFGKYILSSVPFFYLGLPVKILFLKKTFHFCNPYSFIYMLAISGLYIYPIKSLAGIEVKEAQLTGRGFQHDRRWMLVDNENRFLTQREFSQMALLQVGLAIDGLVVSHKINGNNIHIPFLPESTETGIVTVWDSTCIGQFVSNAADIWFTSMLGKPCRLVYMPDTSTIPVDTGYAKHDEITSFSDGYPFLLVGQASLDDLNSRLSEPLPINRFRPNIVFTGGGPFLEDRMAHFTIGQNHFYGVKLCGRCPITTINQDTATKSKEPLKTLATYRSKNNKVYFGQNLLHKGEGLLRVGDIINVLAEKEGLA